jgi:hypothetical protein
VKWVTEEADRDVAILFTPWGEALIRRWYQRAMITLSRAGRCVRVAAQTNLTGSLDWLADIDRDSAALWVTFHPTQLDYDRFLSRARALRELGVRHSIGMVGTREHLPLAQRLRDDLDPEVTLWVNAYKSEGLDYYAAGEVEAYRRIDPLFDLNRVRHPSLGEPCRAGAQAITVDGDGQVRRCHFVTDPIGHLYEQPLDELLGERPCPNATCGCYIGYVHLDRLGLYDLYEGGVLERIPARRPAGLTVLG